MTKVEKGTVEQGVEEGKQLVHIYYQYTNKGYVGSKYDLKINGTQLHVFDEQGNAGRRFACKADCTPVSCAQGNTCEAMLSYLLPKEASACVIRIGISRSDSGKSVVAYYKCDLS